MADAPETFSWLVRFGYGGRGVVYLLLGWLALGTRTRVDAGNQAVFDMLQKMPFGRIALGVLVVGLTGYVAFKLLCLVCDIEHHGTDVKGLRHRLANLGGIVGYSIVAYSALRFALGLKHGVGASQTRATVHTALDWGVGKVAIGIVGIGFILAAAAQVRQAATGHFMHRVSGRAPGWVEWIGRIGFAARGVVFAVVGWSLMRAAWWHHSRDAKGLGEALVSLRASGTLYTLVVIGLMLFGAFSLIVARYLIVPRVERRDLKPALG
jgi:uncharacterized protein DUF1206